MYRIIIVEDDPMISDIYLKKFSDAGFAAEVAVSGREVLTKAKQGGYDLILLDMVMSEMNGLETLAELKRSGLDPKTRIFMFSNLNDAENKEEAARLGADGYLVKTERTPSDLVKYIKETLDRLAGEGQGHTPSGEIVKNQTIGTGTKKRILMIEDEDIFIDLFGKKLEAGGYGVEYAKNGAWGLKLAMDQKFDLIIMDMSMPSMDGRELLAKLGDDEGTKTIPIIVLSATGSEDEAAEMKRLGAVEYLSKSQMVPADLIRKTAEILMQ